MARPKAVIDWKQVDQMLMAQMDGEDIAESLGIHADTLYNACQRDHKMGFSAYSQQKRAKGVAHAKLKFYQTCWIDDNVDPKAQTTSRIFWLKNHAGMSDKVENKLSGSLEVKQGVIVQLPDNGRRTYSPSSPTGPAAGVQQHPG